MQRAVLGYLLLHANHVVPTSRMLRALWDGQPPLTARKMVQNAVSAIRRMLAASSDDSATLLTHPPGYRLQVDPDSVDIHYFRRLVDQGRTALAAGSLGRGTSLLREALALWQGRALADLVERGTTWSELVAMENERLLALEDCFDAELECGRHREITPELEVLTESEPLRERLCMQFMLALYRSGRQADALTIYRRTRAALVDDLGIEPGRELQRLQHMILEHDASIQAPMLVA
ncbi:AfsR/SARP family transcriptional regulator [Actinophytocola sp.]|uniref:AfsR/SARP family transcriptional regulator n=1 Tax=Actinophytocola sp. TaxID=1872138 RepID=UPI002D7FBCF5|nr:AfsR/SARP family transcriptional regulator [Actinophytocola sp.]HET9138353.1 AfsR/SARP family transcriptional regulator [Actinophytocola sp.]